ncbi:uncharacterized protein Bfra_001699 [Botrytis fragariae]|uniref:Uncharacterized protein n=1 Tax=Botrytis fragariae TaxID=1964551 RepID=A0A8H6B1F6_9HELO|nr:uncharacterized protein Bfra_001699 [Botrytis fragariae]KAF5877332.1 hypothetical protein Bfra_001699 [Botrytis fragariae]
MAHGNHFINWWRDIENLCLLPYGWQPLAYQKLLEGFKIFFSSRKSTNVLVQSHRQSSFYQILCYNPYLYQTLAIHTRYGYQRKYRNLPKDMGIASSLSSLPSQNGYLNLLKSVMPPFPCLLRSVGLFLVDLSHPILLVIGTWASDKSQVHLPPGSISHLANITAFQSFAAG